MRLFEAIIDANHRAAGGDRSAGLHPADFADALPLIALSCIDPRLNPLLPEVLGVPESQFIWLRNAGNIITSSTSSTVRSLALACAIKGGREIAILGHTDCLVGKTTILQLTERLKALGVERSRLPENITEFFGIFGSERQNVLKAVEFVRASPLIGPNVPVHGVLVDITSGRLEWVSNGYESLGRAPAPMAAAPGTWPSLDSVLELAPFNLGEMKFPDAKIGELATRVGHAAEKVGQVAAKITDALPGQSKAEQVVEKIEQAAAKVGKAATRVEEWIDKRKPRAGEPQSPPPPPKKSERPAIKPIPMPPPIKPPPPPRRNRDE